MAAHPWKPTAGTSNDGFQVPNLFLSGFHFQLQKLQHLSFPGCISDDSFFSKPSFWAQTFIMNFLCLKGFSVSKFSTCSNTRHRWHSLKSSTNLGWIYENLHSQTNQPFQFVSQLISSTTYTTPNETSSLGWLRERPGASNVKNPRIPPSWKISTKMKWITQCCWWKKSWDV